MSKSPSNKALAATDFYMDIHTFHNSVNGLDIIATVNTAAAASGTVTDAEYDAYTQYTAWRYATFVQHNDFTT